MSKGIVNNTGANKYADMSGTDKSSAFNFGANKPTNGDGTKAGSTATTDRQDNGPISQPKPSEMHRRPIPPGTGNRAS